MNIRKIKFRAWDNKRKKMIERIEEDGEYVVCFNGEICCIKHGNAPFNVTLPQNLFLMQFTGLYDKDGKEIYEGDIVKCLDNSKHLIQRNNDYSAYQLSNRNYIGLEKQNLEDNYKIIGNIYENPELLEIKK